jgi:hypothetical protein
MYCIYIHNQQFTKWLQRCGIITFFLSILVFFLSPHGVSNGSLVGLTAEGALFIVSTGVGFSHSVAPTVDGKNRGLRLVPGVVCFGAFFEAREAATMDSFFFGPLTFFEAKGAATIDCVFFGPVTFFEARGAGTIDHFFDAT